MTNESVYFRDLDLTSLRRFADVVAAQWDAPTVVGLIGTLGAGKTTLAQFIASALGIDSADVTSPTFTLLQTHAVAPSPNANAIEKLHHLDAYRISDSDEWLALGVDELMEDPGAITLVEWADRVADVMPPHTLWITLGLSDQTDRRDLEVQGGRGDLIARLSAGLADQA